jgi:hypothetical protein
MMMPAVLQQLARQGPPSLRAAAAAAAAAASRHASSSSQREQGRPPIIQDNKSQPLSGGRSSETAAVRPLSDPRLQRIVDDVFLVCGC